MSEQQWQMPELLTAWQAVNRTPMAPAAANAIEEALIAANYRIAELTADPWTYITADPATLPPLKKWLLLSLDRSERGRDNANVKAMWDGRHYRAAGDWVIQPPLDGIPYAYQPWPEPAPYPGDETP